MNWIQNFLNNSDDIIVGKQKELRLALVGILAKGHLLIEDIPGVGKTTMVKYLSKSFGLELHRIQFTNDLLPSDILGVNIYNPSNQQFSFHKGAIFGQVILADELNRAGPKTQSALLQVMEEKKVTVDNQTYDVPQPFIVMATQNPRNQIGTNPLPESQLDRFLMKLEMGYPDKKAEVGLLLGVQRDELIAKAAPIINSNQLIEAMEAADKVNVTEALAEYIVNLLHESRYNPSFNALSPRAGLDLIKAAKAWTFTHQRSSVEPEDVQAVAPAVLGHRLVSGHESSVSLERDLANNLINSVNVY